MAVTTNSPSKLTYKQQESTAQFFYESLGTGLALKMMLIPGGTFQMGSPDDELERSDAEGPQHEVTIPPFCMGKYAVTQAEWRFVVGLPQVNQALEADPSEFEGDLHPVKQVSWFDAVEFCARLSVYTKRQYRLPSEAEWEYACRAGTTTPFHFGETITTDLANYAGANDDDSSWLGSYGPGPKGEYRQKTTPVDKFSSPNAFGLCDMHGNVWEWCADHWYNNYEGAPTNGSAWLDERTDANAGRVVRGGCWYHAPQDCRSACRFNDDPRATPYIIGFRVVCNAPRILP
jgi:formylglycine-generating enzyme required for sulfatase activity